MSQESSIDAAYRPGLAHGSSFRPPSHRPSVYHRCELITEGLVYFMVVFGPWAFGTTQNWSVWVMNAAGYALGLLLLVKGLIRRRTGYQPARWTTTGSRESSASTSTSAGGARWLTFGLATLTVGLLLYCLISALNARATYYHDRRWFDYHECITWLPHSYDASSTWFAFWQYLGLACAFWAIRDWLLGKSRRERHREMVGSSDAESQSVMRFPDRLRRLLWVLCINTTLLGMEGIVQRGDGGGKLLWLVEPRLNKSADGQFGPYAYRSNAAQYFNLVWPVGLGFWWCLRQKAKQTSRTRRRMGSSAYIVLLPCMVVMAACPVIATSRGGALIAAGGWLLATLVLSLSVRRDHWLARLWLLLILTVTVGLAGYLGWDKLEKRFQRSQMVNLGGRLEIYENSYPMLNDFGVWGSGPNTFANLYQLYRSDPKQRWQAYAHDDWLETHITFGPIMTMAALLALALTLVRWVLPGGIAASGAFVALVGLALGGCLIHARFDMPLQIHSVLFLFLLLTCILSCLSRKTT